jgi:hypothetical protein
MVIHSGPASGSVKVTTHSCIEVVYSLLYSKTGFTLGHISRFSAPHPESATAEALPCLIKLKSCHHPMINQPLVSVRSRHLPPRNTKGLATPQWSKSGKKA